jgi:hypothetical protein
MRGAIPPLPLYFLVLYYINGLQLIFFFFLIIIQFFIYLRAELNSQWPITESARIHTAIRQHMTKLQQNKKWIT